MPTSPLSVVIQHLQADFSPAGDGMTDGELLARFVRSQDQDALAALVQRHASMVWGVCCRLIRNHHEAEDAFQATFLVLVLKAAGVPRQSIANWLYGVARQTAVRLRATAAKRGRRESQVVNMPEPTMPEVRDADLQRVVDEELSRLPDHYRAVIVLCDLESMTRKEAARQLGMPEGSVASRLARARALLAKRLTHRGFVFFGGSVAPVLSAGSASATVPPDLVAATIQAAGRIAASKAATGVVSAQVAALTQGMVKAMFATKIKKVMAVAMVVGLVLGGIGVGAGLLSSPAAVAQQPGAKPEDGNKGNDAADGTVRVLDDQIARLRKLQKQAELEAAQAKETSAAIERAIGELRAQRDRFLKMANEEKPAQPKLAKTDRERMVGNWFITNDDSLRKGEMWVFTEDSILMYAKNGGANGQLYSHRLDSDKDPKQMDITVTRVNGPVIGVNKGLYVLEGDELRLCVAAVGKDRPVAFPEKPKPGEVLVLQRAASAAAPPKVKEAKPAQTDQERMVGDWVITNADSKFKTDMTWTITPDRIHRHSNIAGFQMQWYHRLDASKDPKQIDIAGQLRGAPVYKGVYILEGDELRLCLGDVGKDRPAAFPEKPKPGEITILQRKKPDAEQPKAKEERPPHFVEKPDMKPQFGWLPQKIEGNVTPENIYVPSKAFIADICLPGKTRIRDLIDPRYLEKHGLTDRDIAYEILDHQGLNSYQVADDLRTILFQVNSKGGGKELIIVKWVVYEGRLYISPEKGPDPKTGIFKPWILRMKMN